MKLQTLFHFMLSFCIVYDVKPTASMFARIFKMLLEQKAQEKNITIRRLQLLVYAYIALLFMRSIHGDSHRMCKEILQPAEDNENLIKFLFMYNRYFYIHLLIVVVCIHRGRRNYGSAFIRTLSLKKSFWMINMFSHD